jgi:hypothetical protein
MADVGKVAPRIHTDGHITLPIGHETGSEINSGFVTGVYTARDTNRPFKGIIPAVDGTLVVHLIADGDAKTIGFAVTAGVPIYPGLFDKVIQAGTTAGLLVAGSKFLW